MNELIKTQSQLPDNIKDLSKFVLVGREKLISVKAEIRAINKLQLAEEVYNQKLEEAQMLSEVVLDAEVQLGDLIKQIPKGSGGDRKSENFKIDSGVVFDNKQKSKAEVIEDLGFTPKQAERFETLAENKDIVEQVKAEARENNDIVTRSRVLEAVASIKKQQADIVYAAPVEPPPPVEESDEYDENQIDIEETVTEADEEEYPVYTVPKGFKELREQKRQDDYSMFMFGDRVDKEFLKITDLADNFITPERMEAWAYYLNHKENLIENQIKNNLNFAENAIAAFTQIKLELLKGEANARKNQGFNIRRVQKESQC